MVLKSKNLEITQAVLICDNFNNEFQPIQSDQELALLKVVNCPLIEYSLRFLKASNIEQVIIFSSNVVKVKKYLIDRKWIKENEELPFAIVRSSDELTSLGDVMRDVFNSNLVKNDFVLLNGNVIGGNIPLIKYLKEHTHRRMNDDKGSIMTMIYGKLDFNHRSRSKENESILVVNKNSQKMLFYETLNNSKKKIDLKLELFQQNSNLKIHFDLQYTNIALCSLAVPQLFADNFDYSTKDDFIRGILVHEEILMNTIYIKTIEDRSYAVKVYDAFSFDAVSRDIIQRWSFPVVPDIQEDLCYHRHNVYKNSTVDLKIDSVLEQNLVIGKRTTIDSNTRIKDSVIGENCKIGRNVRIDGCYLMDNVTVENDCILTKCILSNNVQIKKNCCLKEGCILAANCIIGPNINLEQCTLLQANSEFDEPIDCGLVGKEGKAYLYKMKDDDEDDLDVEVNKHIVQWGLQIKSIRSDEEIDSSEETDESSDLDRNEQSEEEDDFELADKEFKDFYKEVKDSLLRGVKEQVQWKNLKVEINGSKIAFNIPIEDVGFVLVISILDIPNQLNQGLTDEKLFYTTLHKALQHCLPLFKHYVNSIDSQIDCLLALENYALISRNPLFSVNVLVRVLSFLYDNEILNEELILKWYKSFHAFPQMFHKIGNEKRKSLRSNAALQKYINWLEEAEEESSEED